MKNEINDLFHRKNIAILLPSLNEGGAERAASRMTYILQKDYEVYVILFSSEYMKFPYSGRLIDLHSPSGRKGKLHKILNILRRTHRLNHAIKKYNIDSVISFMESPNIVNSLVLNKKYKRYLSIRNFDFNQIDKFTNHMLKCFYKKADGIICVSDKIKKEIEIIYHLPHDKCYVLYNPFDKIEILEYSSLSIEDNLQQITQENYCFASVGRISPQKGFWHLIRAFSLLARTNKFIKLFIIGRDESSGKAKDLIDKLGMNDTIFLLGSKNNPFAYLKRCRGYILTSIYEGFPNAMVEAMICGLPILATDCESGPREILSSRPHETLIESKTLESYGILVPKLSPFEDWTAEFDEKQYEQLCNGILDLLDDKSYDYYKNQSVLRSNDFSYDAFSKKILEILK